MILKTFEIKGIHKLISPDENYELSLESPALDILTDFKKIEPLVIDQSSNLLEAEDLMKKTHVKLKLVLDKGAFVGAISFGDLIGEKAMALANHTPRSEILVSEVMTPRSCLKAIEYKDLRYAKIKDILETLRNEGRQHFLVIDGEEHYIRGIFSASDIARRLHVPIRIDRVSSFVDIYKALKN